MAELAYLALQMLEIELVGIYADGETGKAFLGGKVLGLDQLAHADFDRIVVATLDQPEYTVDHLVALRVAPERIVTLRGRVASGKLSIRSGGPSPTVSAFEPGTTEQ